MFTVRDCDVTIDPKTCGERARYAHHSCNPKPGIMNHLYVSNFRIVLIYAIRGIDGVQEVTVGYN